MMYNLLLLRELSPASLRSELSRIFRVTPRNVDVSDQDEMENRNWDAIVSCEFSQGSGDIPWRLGIYATEEVEAPPTEEDLAAEIACSLHVSVLFPGTIALPSVWHATRSDGETGFVRIAEPEHEDEVLRVTRAEKILPELPNAPSGMLPEVIKELQIPTPVSDSILRPDLTGDRRYVYELLVNWERLTVRMSSGWPPSQWYPPEMFADDLRARDELAEMLKRLEASEQDIVRDLLTSLDTAYRESSVEDGGRSLGEALGAAEANIPLEPAWYWLRRPVDIPWEPHTGS